MAVLLFSGETSYPLNKIVKGVKEYMEMIWVTLGTVFLTVGIFLVFSAPEDNSAIAVYGGIVAFFGMFFLIAGYLKGMQRAKKDRQKEVEEAIARRYYIKILDEMLSELGALRETREKDKQDGS